MKNWKIFQGKGLALGIRVVADSILLSGALLMAFLVRYFFVYGFEGTELSPEHYAREYGNAFIKTVGLLILIGIGVFWVFGFYSKGRSYRGRYKVLVVTQAVAVTYLLLTFSGYIFPSIFYVPRGVLVVGWMIMTVAGVLSRVWSSVWKVLAKEELTKNPSVIVGNDSEHVLVIGGAGYIGSALLPKLLNTGYRVRLLDVFVFGREPIYDMIDHPNLEIVEGDFRQIEKVVESIVGVDSVIHLGGIVGDPACAHDEELTLEINLVATRLIAEVAKAHRIRRFIFASTCSVYGANDALLDEKSQLNPVSLYASSKIASERVLSEVATDEFRPVILRFGTIYGFSGRVRFDLVVNLLTAKAVKEGKITLFGGDQWRPFVHVDDASRAVYLALSSSGDLVDGEIYNVGSDEQNQTLEQVGERIKAIVPDSELVDMGSDSDRRNYRVSFSKIRTILGFKPKWTLDSGIEQVKEALATNRVGDYKEAQYSNVRTITDDKASRLLRFGGWERKLIDESMPKGSDD
jgi:nucleoside-diphosphate-sugar epimerase